MISLFITQNPKLISFLHDFVICSCALILVLRFIGCAPSPMPSLLNSFPFLLPLQFSNSFGEEEMDPFPLSCHLSPLHFRNCNFGFQDSIFDVVPLFETCPNDSFLVLKDIEPNNTIISEDGGENEKKGLERKEGRGKRKWRGERSSSPSKGLSRKTISEYFWMPISQAAKELNVGLTLLKKRCRELGIRRWPHRKLMSLQTLIRNVKELEKEDGVKLRHVLEILENEKKLMEERPDLQLEDNTKRLRQACFKANYKKKRLSGTNNSSATRVHQDDDEEEEDEEMKYLLADCSFSFTGGSLLLY
ncbi:protein RKD2-like [Cucurbita moschata]|uniref:Protein RKD2-like n=1 Tax=Cucurbita moschata TaxID=3662 RepID=A0A6J1F535_CUCMO|nr:protein RKD2-like [Cucurbita moschata]